MEGCSSGSMEIISTSLKYGFKGSSSYSSSGFNYITTTTIVVIAASLLGIAATGKLKKWFFLDRDDDDDDDWKHKQLCLMPAGLQNHVNNCYFNVILQALASCLCFESFLRNIVSECDSLTDETLPVLTNLADLLPRLAILYQQRLVLSPRKLMVALHPYVQFFNLASQQDAAEALLHLLYSLRQEFSHSFIKTHDASLANVTASSCRIVTPHGITKNQKWLQLFLGPFDGILGSILTCQTCSTQNISLLQISLDFQFFHTLSLSASGSTIPLGFTLEDGLREFIGVEQVENYRCTHCWHIAAEKYLSIGLNETDVEKIRRCSRGDSCACRHLSCLEKLPWSNNFSRTLKQLTIARSPKILCFQLQRASMNQFGELVKLQGHIPFPLILNLSPYMASGVGIKQRDESLHRGHANSRFLKPQLIPNHLNSTCDAKMLNCIYGLNSRVLVPNEATIAVSNLIKSKVSYDTKCTNTGMRPDSKESMSDQMSPSIYRLASVVEHFGRVGSGHYSVYRRVQAESDDGESGLPYWFSISDSEVQSVSVKDVLGSEASLLFYERI
ncbi:hypothetical protein ACFE04_021075 [Oxalis oulophora]